MCPDEGVEKNCLTFYTTWCNITMMGTLFNVIYYLLVGYETNREKIIVQFQEKTR